MSHITLEPIGYIRSPHLRLEEMPIQPAGAKGVAGRAEINPEFAEGLVDLDGFSHVILLYHFHKSQGFELTVTPFLDKTPRGLFATRAPRRPNPVGLSIVRLVSVEGNVLNLMDVDILDKTPLIDVKPFVDAFDCPPADRFGWLDKSRAGTSKARSDGRFVAEKNKD